MTVGQLLDVVDLVNIKYFYINKKQQPLSYITSVCNEKEIESISIITSIEQLTTQDIGINLFTDNPEEYLDLIDVTYTLPNNPIYIGIHLYIELKGGAL